MADISQITLPSGSTYNIKDAHARELIASIETSITGAMSYVGVTTTALSDGSNTNPIVINGNSHTAKSGDVAIYGDKEFVFNGTIWNEFGDMGSLKALAFKDSASGTYTPAGSVSQPTFTGTEASVSITGTPSGTVSKPSFTGTQATITVSGTPTGNVTISKAASGTANYTPEGSVSQPTFTGTSFTSSGSYKPEGSVTISTAQTGTANYTPAGTVSTPTITVTPNTTTVNSITDVGTLPSWTGTVANENLTIGWSTGTLPTKGSNTTVATGIKSATSTQPSFTGTGAVLTGSFSGTSKTVSVSGTATGTVSQPTFTGTGAVLQGSFTGTSFNSTGSYTPAGSVSQPTFSGDEFESTATFTPAGTVSKPSFTGTQATITVS